MKKFVILISLYNDWKSVSRLLKEIDLQIIKWESEVSVLVVNDASTEKRSYMNLDLEVIKSLKIINIKKNQGHARCFATGLKFIFEKENFDYVILMDADGEDRPEELNLLFKKSKEHPQKAIVAERIKRSEGPIFRFCYQMHKYLTFIFTGKSIKFGNYTCLPKTYVSQMLKSAATWNSFSGSLASISKDRVSIPSIRGSRYFDPSQMSFFNLIKHSLSIIAVFKISFFLRSFLFLILYLFFTFNYLSVITIIPIFLILILIFSVALLSRRENLNQLDSSLDNILKIEQIK